MNVQILEKTDTNLRFVIQDADASFVNALRRIILSEVPCMAIDQVVIIENSSMQHDEILAHRMGLIPLKTNLDAYNLREECECKSELGCNLCRVVLTLDVEAADTTTVYSGNLTSENPEITPVSSKIPIVKLAPGQKLKLEADARLGRGKEHAKWQPVVVCAYKNMPIIKINPKLCDACGECVKVCPKNVFASADGKIEVKNLLNCTLCQDCVNSCPKSPKALEIDWDKNTFVFNVESSGVLPPERIVQEALKILDKKTAEFLKELAGEKSETS